MFNFRSQANYDSLKKFLSPQMEQLQKMLTSNLFNSKEMDYIVLALKDEFSTDFFECLKIARQSFCGYDLIFLFKELYNQLKHLYETKKCIIITATLMNDIEKIELEKALNAKFKNKNEDENFDFIYECDKNIIGGLIIKIGRSYYDGSFKKVLSNLKFMVKESI